MSWTSYDRPRPCCSGSAAAWGNRGCRSLGPEARTVVTIGCDPLHDYTFNCIHRAAWGRGWPQPRAAHSDPLKRKKSFPDRRLCAGSWEMASVNSPFGRFKGPSQRRALRPFHYFGRHLDCGWSLATSSQRHRCRRRAIGTRGEQRQHHEARGIAVQSSLFKTSAEVRFSIGHQKVGCFSGSTSPPAPSCVAVSRCPPSAGRP